MIFAATKFTLKARLDSVFVSCVVDSEAGVDAFGVEGSEEL